MLNNENYGGIVVVVEHRENILTIQYEHPMDTNDENEIKVESPYRQCGFTLAYLIEFTASKKTDSHQNIRKNLNHNSNNHHRASLILTQHRIEFLMTIG